MVVVVARSSGGGPGVVFRSDLAWHDQAYLERRQAFLRSYQLGRGAAAEEHDDGELQAEKRKKKTIACRCAAVAARVRLSVGSQLRSARRLVWARLRRQAQRSVHKLRLGLLDSGRMRRRPPRLAVTGLTARDWFGTPARQLMHKIRKKKKKAHN